MIYSDAKIVKVRKPHKCTCCGGDIPPRTKAQWFKNVVIKESQPDTFHEGYLCKDCCPKAERQLDIAEAGE